ncbi:MAG: efflux RND transporter periplasmic adaptor subunit [Deltaproteobacteria bacterium]|nr:efflux RND transporter periplasmic adaptor subunit [Deltaproteobacteria bacterium]MCB9787519.1 efflux RND transporter periplasmic adaptor subunit [Deltaproteobacteria bacterium]
MMRRFMIPAAIVAALLVGAVAGMFVAAPPATPPAPRGLAGTAADDGEGEPAKAPVYTCAMHPQIRLPEPGQCPICGMDLILASAEAAAQPSAEVSLSPEAQALARIQTASVERRPASVDLRLTGRIALDETRVATITAWLGGRIERMFVDATGTRVEKGDHLFELYSPELYVAQQDYVEAARLARRMEPLGGEAAEGAKLAAEAARQKLRLWGLREWQIRQVASDRKPRRTVTIYAPIGGTVTAKSALQGEYVETGSPIYTIADLSRVWVILDAHESELRWLRYGQEVAIEAEAAPGPSISGTVSFISPTLDPRTRTVPVRVAVDNPGEALKPGMFVRGRVSASVGGGGASAVSGLAGKWISPMHPEVVADAPGRCEVCGMPLVPAEEHWLVGPQLRAEAGGVLPLVIPATAPLWTGKRTVVFVEVPDRERPTYALREVELGPRVADGVVVRSGLVEGERVVREGAFKLDSALQIRGDTSMMTLDSQAEAHEHGHAAPAAQAPPPGGEATPAFTAALDATVSRVARLTAALAADDLEAARGLVGPLGEATTELAAVAPGPLDPALLAAAEALRGSTDLTGQRAALGRFMDGLEPLLRTWGAGLSRPWEMVRCPMAREGAGALWLQAPGAVANPYYGPAMLRCGDVELRGEGAGETP